MCSICVACGRRWKQCPDEADRVIWAQSVEDAVEYLQNTEGKILITTGSKELIKYTKLTEYKERCFARVLSTEQAVMESVALGFEGKHLIAMQGPFSKEMNVATIHQTGAKYFVTKESGKSRRLWRKGTGGKGNRGSSCCGRKTKRNRENIFRSL